MEAKERTRRDVAYRLQKLERKLKTLDQMQPTYLLERDLLQKEINLIKGELQAVKQPRANHAVTTKRNQSSNGNGRLQKTRNRRKQVQQPSTKDSAAIIPKNHFSQILSKDPIGAIGNIRTTFKQWMNYIQQADKMLDTLFITTNSLNESGVLQKLIKSKGKNLNTDDLTNILMALMNSPVGGDLLKKAGQNNQEQPQPESTNVL